MISSLHRCEASGTEAQSSTSLSLHNKSKWYSLVLFPQKLESDVDRLSPAGICVQTLLMLLRLDCDLILLTSICNTIKYLLLTHLCASVFLLPFSMGDGDGYERQMNLSYITKPVVQTVA